MTEAQSILFRSLRVSRMVKRKTQDRVDSDGSNLDKTGGEIQFKYSKTKLNV